MDQNVRYTVTAQDLLSGQLQNMNANANVLNNTMGSITSTFAKIGIGIGLAEIGKNIIDTMSKFETFEAVLTNTLGSNSAAQHSLAQLNEFSQKTPFEIDELTDSFVRLANQGFTPTMEEMTKLGDLASSKGKGMKDLSEALIDAQVGEFERLKEFGVRASKHGNMVSMTFKGQTVEVKNTDSAIKNYILSLGDLQGVSGSMAAISETTGGQISNLKDKVTNLMLEIGQGLKPIISTIIERLGYFIQNLRDVWYWIKENATIVKTLAIFIGSVVAAYKLKAMWIAFTTGLTVVQIIKNGVMIFQQGVMFAQLGGLSTAGSIWAGVMAVINAVMSANPIGLIIIAIAALIAGISYLIIRFSGWGEAWQHTIKAVKYFWEAFVLAFKASWLQTKNSFLNGLDAIKEAWLNFKNLVGIGDESENNKMIAQIHEDQEKRKSEIQKTYLQRDLAFAQSKYEGAMTKVALIKATALADFKEKLEEVNKIGAAGIDKEEWKKNYSELAKFVNENIKDKKLNVSDVIDNKGYKGHIKGLNNFFEMKQPTGLPPNGGGVGGIGAGGSNTKGAKGVSGTKSVSITVNINNLVNGFTIKTTNIQEGAEAVKQHVINALTSAVNDSQIIAGKG